MLVTIALTRLLDPSTFGIMAICTLTISLGDLFTGVGFGPALVHRQVINRKQISSAMGASAIMGALLATIVALLAGPISSFFNAPDARHR